jgi:hypothetical protein
LRSAERGTLAAVRTSRLTAGVAVVTGLLWMLASALSWQDDGLDDPSTTVWWIGLGGFALASALTGYAAVTQSPIWLRIVVFVCAGALGGSVLSALDVDMPSAYLVVGALGTATLMVGVLTLVRGRGEVADHEPPLRGRRAGR